ncbi:hypothetical protein Ntsu_28780 [Nocardia sp. IFM 10818]
MMADGAGRDRIVEHIGDDDHGAPGHRARATTVPGCPGIGDVQGDIEGLGHFAGHLDTARRDGEHRHIGSAEGAQSIDQSATCLPAVTKQHESAPEVSASAGSPVAKNGVSQRIQP